MLHLNLKSEEKIGIMFSGGIDSTLLLYLLSKQALEKNCSINLFTIPKFTGTYDYVNIIRDYFDYMFDIELPETNVVGYQNVSHELFLGCGILESFEKFDIDYMYVGSTKNPTIKFDGAPNRYKHADTRIKQPFFNLTKVDIIKMYYQLEIENLLKFTHSCTMQNIGSCKRCFFCNERKWGFDSLNLLDPASS